MVDARENGRLFSYEDGVKQSFDKIKPVLKQISAFQHEADFEQRLAGNPVYRIGHACWLRNIAVALGNAPGDAAIVAALTEKLSHPSELVREHVLWALEQQGVPA